MRTHPEITVSIGGGRALDRTGLASNAASPPGFHVIPQNNDPLPQVLVWATCPGSMEWPLPKSGTKLLLLTETTTEDSLPDAVRGLFSREETGSALATAILEKRQSKSKRASPEMSLVDELTEREREILDLLAQGLSNKLSASKLYLSVRTVEDHLANIYLHLGFHSRTEAMLMAMKVR